MARSNDQSLPQPVRTVVAARCAAQPDPVVLHLDARRRLVSVHGDCATIALPALEHGCDLNPVLPFLTGSDLWRLEHLECVDPGTGHALDIDYLPDDNGGAWLVLTSAERRRREREALQLTANEMRLATQRQQRLVDQLIETRSELDLRRREAEEALRVKSRFIASMSHEFRTPLTSVIGYAEWLSNSLEEPALRQAQSIVRAGQHMLTLVDNLLAQASLQGGGVSARIERVELRSIAEDISAIMAPLAADKGIAYAAFVGADLPEIVMLDEMRLRQVLINLLGNAVKFTDEGYVNLVMNWREGQLHLEVADSGPGIPDKDRARIFAAFERLEGAHGKAGAGLGLHITLEIVKLLNGSIGLDSTPGEGTRFHVRLPAPVAPEQHETTVRNGASVLVAEDDPDVVALLALYLKRAGYEVRLASNGRDALEQIGQSAPDLVILDLNMPVLDGIGTVRELRAGIYAGPIVALTGATMDEERIRAVDAGFDAFVPKPVRMPELLAVLGELLR